jgi:hypothetical protein
MNDGSIQVDPANLIEAIVAQRNEANDRAAKWEAVAQGLARDIQTLRDALAEKETGVHQ